MRLKFIIEQLLVLIESNNEASWIKVLQKSKLPIKLIAAILPSQYPVILSNYKGDNAIPLGEAGDQALQSIINRVKEITSQYGKEISKFTAYWIYQIAKGNILLQRLEEDSPRLVNTISGFAKYNRKAAWTSSKNLYDYDNWKDLEKTVVKLQNKDREAQDFSSTNKQAEIIFEKSYVDPNAVITFELLGLKPPKITYWLRRLHSVEATYKYGRGTEWCTATDPEPYLKRLPKKGYAEDRYFERTERPSFMYLPYGLFLVEKQVEGEESSNRKPIMQICCNHPMSSTGDIMTINDIPVIAIKGNLYRFFKDCLPILHQMTPSDQNGTYSFSGAEYLEIERSVWGDNIIRNNEISEKDIYTKLITIIQDLVTTYEKGNKTVHNR